MTYYDDVVTGTSGVTHYYKFEGNGNDSVGTDNFTIASGYTTSSAGKEGNGLNADANTKTGSYLTSSLSSIFGSTYSVEFWFKLTTNASSQELMRVADDLALEMGTDGKILYYYKGTSGTTAASWGDGAWHHMVITRDGSRNVIVYIDGTSVITFTAPTGAPTSGNVYFAGSQYTAQAFRSGAMDSISLYNVALTSTQVNDHYNAMGVVNGGYTAQAMTASATAPGGTGLGNTQTLAVTDDAYVWAASPNTNFSTDPALSILSDPHAYLKTIAPSGSEYEVSRTLYADNGNVTGTWSVGVYRVNADWSESTLTYNNRPSVTLVRTVSVTVGSGDSGKFTVNITGADIGYGVALSSSSPLGLLTSENATAGDRPYVVLATAPQANVNHNAGVATASAAMPNATVVTEGNAHYGAQPMTASALAVDPDVDTTRNIDISAEDMEAFATMPDGAGFAIPVTVTAEVMTADAAVVEPDVETTQGVNYAAQPMTATATWKKPTEVNGAPIVESEEDDAYFQRVWAEVPKMWFRLNDAGSIAEDRMGGPAGSYHGVLVNQYDGPENRNSVYFDGTGSIEQAEPAGTNVDEAIMTTGRARSTLEFSFRTTKANTFLMVTRDAQSNPTTLTQTANAPREIYLRDGKIALRSHFYPNSLGQARAPYEFRGLNNLADGQWHSVVIKGYRTWAGGSGAGEEGVEIWVDGKFEIRRTEFSGAVPLLGFPDWIGSRPDTIDGDYIGALPSSLNFVGDMSEVVFYDHLVSDHEITRHYYDFMGWNPIEATSMDAFAFAPVGARGKGNQKRALVLHWYGYDDGYSIGGDGWNNKMNFNALAGQTNEFAGYKLFWHSVDDRGGQSYRDPVTDVPSLINLEYDIDIEDYDVIMFKDWPDEGPELDDINTFFPGSYERLVEQLRWANDQGIGLFVTHPRLAVDLGIVDRVEFVPTLEENTYTNAQGNAFGLYDYGSAVKYPWNITASSGLNWPGTGSMYNGDAMNTDPAFLANKALFYGDTNKNDRFRVRALIEGLTDIPSYMIRDAIYHKDYDLYGWQSVAFKYLHRLDGLQIGDEFIFHGTDLGKDYDGVSNDFTDVRLGRWFGYYAAPLANVKAGTVVTTFGATQWKGNSQIDNPYKDYATTIVLRPGDNLKGRAVGGKIYVNFTEQPSRQPETVSIQVLPEEGGTFPVGYKPDTAAQREWEWSDTRKSLRSTNESPTIPIQVVMPDGSTVTVGVSGGGSQLSMTRSANLFPVVDEISWQMNRRGLWWLMDAPEQEEGAVQVSATPINATASMPNPSVLAEKDADATAQPMVALAQMPKVAEDASGDVDIVTLPWTAYAEFTGFSKVISAAPMTATAEFVENFDLVHADGEQVVLYLHGFDAELYLKEEV